MEQVQPIMRSPWWTTPPGRPLTFFALAIALVVLWATSLPGGNFMLLILVFWPMVIFAGAWLIRVGVALLSRPFRRWDNRFAVIPVLGLITLNLVAVDAPERLRWLYAQPQLERAAHESPLREGERTIGSYPVDVSLREGIPWFRITEAGFLNSEYLVYTTDPAAIAPNSQRRISHYRGDWWRVTDIF